VREGRRYAYRPIDKETRIALLCVLFPPLSTIDAAYRKTDIVRKIATTLNTTPTERVQRPYARVFVNTIHQTILIRTAAIQKSTQPSYVYVVGSHGIDSQRAITINATPGDITIHKRAPENVLHS
jgi:hypothetical protein